MRRCFVIWLLIAVLFGASDRSHAAEGFVLDPDAFENGRAVAVGASVASTETACFRCHGMEGQGDAAAVFPRLSNQPPEYLYAALRDYASGLRNNPVMTPIARMLDDAQMRHVSVFYARQSAEPRGRSDKVQDIRLPQRVRLSRRWAMPSVRCRAASIVMAPKDEALRRPIPLSPVNTKNTSRRS